MLISRAHIAIYSARRCTFFFTFFVLLCADSRSNVQHLGFVRQRATATKVGVRGGGILHSRTTQMNYDDSVHLISPRAINPACVVLCVPLRSPTDWRTGRRKHRSVADRAYPFGAHRLIKCIRFASYFSPAWEDCTIWLYWKAWIHMVVERGGAVRCRRAGVSRSAP